jgi:hypothetical protein
MGEEWMGGEWTGTKRQAAFDAETSLKEHSIWQ